MILWAFLLFWDSVFLIVDIIAFIKYKQEKND